MNTEKVDFFAEVIGAKRTMADFLSAGSDDNRVQLIVTPNRTSKSAASN